MYKRIQQFKIISNLSNHRVYNNKSKKSSCRKIKAKKYKNNNKQSKFRIKNQKLYLEVNKKKL